MDSCHIQLGSAKGPVSVARSMVSTPFSVDEGVDAPEAAGALLNTLDHVPQPRTFTAAKH